MDMYQNQNKESVPWGTSRQYEETSRPFGSTWSVVSFDQRLPCENASEPRVLSKTQKRNLRKRKNKGEQPTAASEEDGRHRRPWSEVYAPFNVSANPKMPRLQPATFAYGPKWTRLAILKESYPLVSLSPSEVQNIQEDILRRIDLLPAGDHLPRLSTPTLVQGALTFRCDDAWTVDWLKKVFHGNSDVLVDSTLQVIPENELPKPVKVAFKTKDTITKESSDLLKRISRYNSKLKTEDWRVLDKNVEPLSIRWIFEVSFASAMEIKAAGHKAYTGLDKGTFKILSDPNVITPKELHQEVMDEEEDCSAVYGTSYSEDKEDFWAPI